MTFNPTIRIEDIPASGRELDEALPESFAADLLPSALGLRPNGQGRARLRLEKRGDQVSVEARAEVPFSGPCARCLGEVQDQLHSDFSLTLFRRDQAQPAAAAAEPGPARGAAAKKAAAPEIELSADDFGSGEYDGKRIEWGELVHEQLVLELPMVVTCAEDCKGLCAECGVNKNLRECNCAESKIDPRWEKLRLLK